MLFVIAKQLNVSSSRQIQGIVGQATKAEGVALCRHK
jgi:hypothetical protein